MIKPLLIDVEKYISDDFVKTRKGTGLPNGYGLRKIKLLGKGSNNQVFLFKSKYDQFLVVRTPLRKADTQHLENAALEFRYSLIASDLNIGPKIFDAWFVRHATSDQKNGLHMITEYFEEDMHSFVLDNPILATQHIESIREMLTNNFRVLADNCIFCYDLKLCNLVIRREPLEIKIIDFGTDFTEKREFCPYRENVNAPVLSLVQQIVDESNASESTKQNLYKDLIYVLMMILMSSNITYTLQKSTRIVKHIFTSESTIINFLYPVLQNIRSTMRGVHIRMIKKLLRHKEIRSNLRHYFGRRNCGTKRVFRLAGFCKQI